MIMSGTDAHLGGLGTLIEWKNTEFGEKRWAGKAGYEGYLNKEVSVLPEVLRGEGYWTVMSGKVGVVSTQTSQRLRRLGALGVPWLSRRLSRPGGKADMEWHLGMRQDQGPWARGFDKTFTMLPGCCNHYGWEPVQERFPVGGRPVHADDQGVKADMWVAAALEIRCLSASSRGLGAVGATRSSQ